MNADSVAGTELARACSRTKAAALRSWAIGFGQFWPAEKKMRTDLACLFPAVAALATLPASACAQCWLGAYTHRTDLHVADIDTEGSLIFLANEWGDLVIVDASVPGNPVEAGVIELPVYNVDAVGTVAYVLTLDGFFAFDVSNPAEPTVLGSISLAPTMGFLKVVGSVAYVGGHYGTPPFTAIDVSDPAHPVVIGELKSVQGESIDINGSLAYVAGDDGIRIVDIRDPSKMVLRSEFQPCIEWRCMEPRDAVVERDRLYFTARYSRSYDALGVLDVSDPDTPEVLGYRLDLAEFSHFDIRGNRLYTSFEYFGRLRALDVSEPDEIRLLGAREVADWRASMEVFIEGDRMIVSVLDGIELFDIGEGCGPCSADVNADGRLDGDDFEAWAGAYQRDDISADQNVDLHVTPADFGAWIANFNAGCD